MVLDRFIVEFDKGLRTVFAKPANIRANPAEDLAEAELSDAEKKQVIALMRVNHTGEVCAQALYSGDLSSYHLLQVSHFVVSVIFALLP